MATFVSNLFDKLSGSKWNAGVTFERTNPVPLEKYSVFHAYEDAETYAATSPVAYPGQLLAVVTDTAVTTYKINVDRTLSQIDATIAADDLPIEAGAGIEFGESDGKTTINAKLHAGNGLTTDASGFLSVQQVDFDTVVDGTTSGSGNAAYTSAVYNALTALSTAANSNYVSVGIAEAATADDKLLKASSVSSAASAIADVVLEHAFSNGIAGGNAGKTLTAIGYDTSNSALTGEYADISIASANVVGLTDYVSSVSASTLTAANNYSDNISNVLSSLLSDAWQNRLSDAASTNPVILSSDISAMLKAGVTFGGVYGSLADISGITSAVPGQVYVLTGAGYDGKEYICKAKNETPAAENFVEVGNEGAIADLASKMVSAIYVGSTKLLATGNELSITAAHVSALFNANQLCSYAQISSQICTDLSINKYAKTADFDGTVGLSTIAQVNEALELGDLAYKDVVGTTDISDNAVTHDKLALNSVTSENLSGLFVLSCGNAICDNLSVKANGEVVSYPTT